MSLLELSPRRQAVLDSRPALSDQAIPHRAAVENHRMKQKERWRRLGSRGRKKPEREL